jgi:hypothetical protein
MKKLSKLSLLGEMDLLSKAELKRLVGSDGGCSSKKETCGGSCVAGNNNGVCEWVSNSHITGCLCNPGPFGGLTDYSYSGGY